MKNGKGKVGKQGITSEDLSRRNLGYLSMARSR